MEELEIVIAGKSFNMKVDRSRVEFYRLAEQRLNASIVRLEKMNYEGVGSRDIISLAAFEFALSATTLTQQMATEGGERDEKLEQINDRMKSYLNDLRNEKM